MAGLAAAAEVEGELVAGVGVGAVGPASGQVEPFVALGAAEVALVV